MHANVVGGERLDLTGEEITYYRKVLNVHANSGAAGRCGICRQRRCREWTVAFDTIAGAHALMGTGAEWDRRSLCEAAI